MLKALYDYAIQHELTLPAGYVKKTVKAYISLSSADPTYVEIRMGDDEAVPCPDVGNLAKGPNKSNVLVEKRSVVVPAVPTPKSESYRETLTACSVFAPTIRVCVEALQNEHILAEMQVKLDQLKIKESDRLSFMVDNRSILNAEGVLDWWQDFRSQFMKKNSSDEQIPCLITGKRTEPLATVPTVAGLYTVGGQGSGDALICFDKNAFCSYGLKQAANAPVSEEAFGAVKAALDALLADAPVLAGMKFVHWYDRDVAPELDPICSEEVFGYDSAEDEEEDGEEQLSMDVQVSPQEERDARSNANRLVETVESGNTSVPLDTNYYILLLSGMSGRVMVRRYLRGRYETLQENLSLWESDLRLKNAFGTSTIKPQKLKTRFGRLLKYQKTENDFFKRLSKELSGVSPAVLTAILEDTELPDAVAVRALAYIRSKMFADAEEDASRNLDGIACQWLKAWLIRKNGRNEEKLMEEYNKDHSNPAYHCGAMMAIYAAIQQDADPNVNVSVVQRFYASALQSPALVLGRLSQLSVHHLEKLESKSTVAANRYRDQLAQCSVSIGNSVPTTLNLAQQSYFALGYYQMQAKLSQETRERIAIARERKQNKQTEGEE